MMKKGFFFFLAFYLLLNISDVYAQDDVLKPRIFVLTDINNEPDDEESLVRLLVYSNEFNIEGLVATTSCWLKEDTREDLIRKQLVAYGLVYDNLIKHAIGFPTQKYLESVTCTGQATYGMEAIGVGKNTKGSDLLTNAIINNDTRPLWILVWGGANTLAQALLDLRAKLGDAELNACISKLKIYAISDQDDAGHWIRKEFPTLFYIVDPSNPDFQSYYTATWNGIAGDRHNGTEVKYYFDLVDNPWLEENIMKGHGALGKCYPPLKFQMEGDTPSFLGLINNGLGWNICPSYGGWGSRYDLYRAYGESRAIWTSNKNSRDTFEYEKGKNYTSNGTTIWRWRNHFQYDFAARMDWCISDSYEKANHNPIAVLNDDYTKDVLYIKAEGKQAISLSAVGTSDPDKNNIAVKWWIYQEAGNVTGALLNTSEGLVTRVDLSNAVGEKLHVILEVKDDGVPNLYSYRRVVIIL